MSVSPAQLRQVFDGFDVDKSGSIELKQLDNVANKLGKPLQADQLKKIVKILDTNNDGKISYQEFEEWWLKGMDGKLAELVYLKCRAMKLSNKVMKKFKNAKIFLKDLVSKSKPDRYDFKVKFGEPSTDSISLETNFYVKGSKQEQIINQIKQIMPQLPQKPVGLIFKLASSNPSVAKAQFDKFLNDLILQGQLPIPIESLYDNSFIEYKTFVEGNNLVIKVILKQAIIQALAPTLQPTSAVLAQIGEDFYSFMNFKITLNSNIKNLLERSPLENLLKGFEISYFTEANNSALKTLRKLSERQMGWLPPPASLFSLFRSAKLHLHLKTPNQLDKFFKNLGIQDIVGGLPNLGDMLEQISNSVIEETKVNALAGFGYKLSHFLFKNIEKQVQIYFLIAGVGTGSIKIVAPGASEIHANLFNQC